MTGNDAVFDWTDIALWFVSDLQKSEYPSVLLVEIEINETLLILRLVVCLNKLAR